MILIADSGSTTTTWVLVNPPGEIAGKCQTTGINPYYQEESEILASIARDFDLATSDISNIYFYGAGCSFPEKKKIVERALNAAFNAGSVHLESDLLGAARSLCGSRPGIAAILGTGSNSCYYNGNRIVMQVPSLGFILGDEGSGAAMGKKLVAGVFKKLLPPGICNLFLETQQVSMEQLLDRVYRHPFPNRFLATFTRFIQSNLEEESMQTLVIECFVDFFSTNINQYHTGDKLPVNFTGSIAWHFREQLSRAALITGNTIGEVTPDPLKGLVGYHSLNQAPG